MINEVLQTKAAFGIVRSQQDFVDHFLVAWFEDVQRHGSAGQQDHIEREECDQAHSAIVRQPVLAFKSGIRDPHWK